MPKSKPAFAPIRSIRITTAAHKKLRIHCAKTGEKLGVAATRAVLEYVKHFPEEERNLTPDAK